MHVEKIRIATERLETEWTTSKLIELGEGWKKQQINPNEGYKEDKKKHRHWQNKKHKVIGKHKFKHINN